MTMRTMLSLYGGRQPQYQNITCCSVVCPCRGRTGRPTRHHEGIVVLLDARMNYLLPKMDIITEENKGKWGMFSKTKTKTFEDDLDGDQERKLGRSIMFAFDDDASGGLDIGEFDSAFDWAVEGGIILIALLVCAGRGWKPLRLGSGSTRREIIAISGRLKPKHACPEAPRPVSCV